LSNQPLNVPLQQAAEHFRHTDITQFGQALDFLRLVLPNQLPEQTTGEDEQNQRKQREIANESRGTHFNRSGLTGSTYTNTKKRNVGGKADALNRNPAATRIFA
jgi:hypothetical protein